MGKWFKMAAGLLGIALGLAGYGFIVKPRAVLRDFDAFIERHPVGSSLESLAGDPFIGRASMVQVNNEFPLEYGEPAQEPGEALRQELNGLSEGSGSIVWMHTPPFGRAIANFTFAGGKITAMEKNYLD